MSISPIIELDELLKIYKCSNVMIFDVSNSKNAKTNYEKEHIEGAFFVDLNTQLAVIKSDFSEGGRHPLPQIENFARTLTYLGISKDKHIVIYDDKNGSNAAARFWWMLKSAGQEKVQVLNGGINQAKNNNFPLSSKIESVQTLSEPYKIDQWNLPIIEINEVESVAQNPSYLVVDVRDKERYEGIIEPIDLIAGHIPGSVNIPFTENLDYNGLFLKPNELKNKYETIFGDISNENIIVHCGSGVTACHSLLALAYAEMEIPKLYVGSWSEWSRSNKQIEKTNT
jgi:thiosulfate/3-mercaptopyruvate sulfurtransferase